MAALDSDRAITELLEALIKSSNLVETYNNKCIDFKTRDVVQCSYLKGLFEVTGKTVNYVTITPINNSLEEFSVGPSFLKKVQLNQGVRRILYD